MKQLNDQQHGVVKKHLLYLKLEELKRTANLELPTLERSVTEESHAGLIICEPVAEPKVNMADLLPDVSCLQQQIMNCISTVQGQMSDLPKLRCKIPNENLIQVNIQYGQPIELKPTH